ncbi:MAG: hypothetical protein LBR44_03855 [Clostridiales Family XIII bacterium]|nr:hypothetical protein [Clostridiales Family XIII bacterium]
MANGLHADCFDFDEEVCAFIGEMDRGLRGEPSSLRMLPAYLDASADIPEEGDAIAVDAGGTNLRVALVRFRAGQPPEIASKTKIPVPGAGSPVTMEAFFDRVVEQVLPIAGESDRLGMCFSFPSEILPSRDSRILCFDKELKVTGSEGAHIAPGLNAALARAGLPPKRVTVLNDSAAALLGELAVQPPKDYCGYVGLIFGTGMNFCYNEKISKIAKLDAAALPRDMQAMLINTEAGGYGGFRQSACDRALDLASVNPGEQRFEKMVSGAYFGALALRVLKFAAEEGLFGADALSQLHAQEGMGASDVSAFMEAFADDDDDRRMIFALLDGLLGRSAKLISIAITAAMRQGGCCPELPVFFVAEGSSFKKSFRFQERFERMLHEYAGDDVCYELILAENHTLIGAAAAVFL